MKKQLVHPKKITKPKALRDNRKCEIAVAVGANLKNDRGLFALINSVITNYKNDSRVLCVFTFSEEPDFDPFVKNLECTFDTVPQNVRIIPQKITKESWNPRIFSKTHERHRPELDSDYNWFRYYLTPENVEGLSKVVWLDSDTIVTTNIAELYDWNLNGQVVAAGSYHEPLRVHLCGGNPELKKINMSYHGKSMTPLELPKHMNAGVLVMDLIEMKKQGILEEWHRLVKLHEQKCLWNLANQPPFTLAIQGKYEELPGEWNVGYLGCSPAYQEPHGFSCDEGKILHWNGEMKPWSSEDAACKDIFRKYDILSKSKSQCASKS